MQKNAEEEEKLYKGHSVNIQRISACLHVPRMKVWQTLHTEGLTVSVITSKLSILNLGTQIGSWNSASGLVNNPTLYSPMQLNLPVMRSTILEISISGLMKIHYKQ
jgi:hypothetical protein